MPRVPVERLEFAARLKELRFLRGYHTAKQFARALGIEQNTYTRYERAEVEPSLTVIDKMCRLLNVMPNELLGFGTDENLVRRDEPTA
jgi:transcriptional regulator with XRE-family HTH domain